jgi:heptaprenyl diphosphate synthase
MLTLSAAAVCGVPINPDIIQGSVSVELVHLGSLYHDDVIDAAESRRGVPSVNARYGNLVAILAGDYLLARASELAAALGAEIAGLLGTTITQLCRGEVSQLQFAFDIRRTEAAYLRSIEGKTASLLSTSARVGALVAGAGRSEVEALTEFGRNFGMAFQIWDDISDLVSTENELGKPAGHDMVEGTYTLPVIRALGIPAPAEELKALLGRQIDAPTRDKAREIVLSTDAVLASVMVGRQYADRAAEALGGFIADGEGTRSLVVSMSRLAHHLFDSLDVE